MYKSVSPVGTRYSVVAHCSLIFSANDSSGHSLISAYRPLGILSILDLPQGDPMCRPVGNKRRSTGRN